MKNNPLYHAVSECGMRENNEDLVLVNPIGHDGSLLAVCIDGVGGENGGEVAASIAARSISSCLSGMSHPSLEALRMAVVSANNDIIEMQRLPAMSHMSCVLTACIVDPDSSIIHVCHVGDTRLYAYSPARKSLQKLTSDHSYVGHLYDLGILTEEQARNHPRRNMINRGLGFQTLDYTTSYIQFVSIPSEPSDRLLLCTDGLYDAVSSECIASVLGESLNPETAVDTLVRLAAEGGSHDNISAIAIFL